MVGFGFHSNNFTSGLTNGLSMTNRTGKANVSAVDLIIWSWVMLKLQSGRVRDKTIHGPSGMFGPIDGLKLSCIVPDVLILVLI